MQKTVQKFTRNRFLFEELIKRDFKKKYKRTVLGMGWSVLNPLLQLFVMRLVFTGFFGADMPFYTTYVFAGNLMFHFFRESTEGGMHALKDNAHIFSKVNVPKYMFLVSKNVSAIINFALSMVVFFFFVFLDGVPFSLTFFAILFPIACMTGFNIGTGLVLSAMELFFEDTHYLYDVFLLMLMYVSAIFYSVDSFGPAMQKLFLCNPVYVYIRYIRIAVLDGAVPPPGLHILAALYAAAALLVGGLVYKYNNHKFLYYV